MRFVWLLILCVWGSGELAAETACRGVKGEDGLSPWLRGIASWYGPGFHGKRTANGEIYDQHALTAAHPNLPMGTRIEVKNLHNGHKIKLRVNDRGPYSRGRVLDVSRTAAIQLQMLRVGVATVQIQVLCWPTDIDQHLGLIAYRQYVVQVGVFDTQLEAQAALNQLETQVQMPLLLDLRPHKAYALVAGPYYSIRKARQTATLLQKKGWSTFIRQRRK